MNKSFRVTPSVPKTYEGTFQYTFTNHRTAEWVHLNVPFKADFTTKLLQVWFITKDLNQQAPEMGIWVKTATILLESHVDDQLKRVTEEIENYGGDAQQAMCSLGYTFLEAPTPPDPA
jgi:hypothetical protein